MSISVNVWLKDKITIYVGGIPEKGQPPLITLTINDPQLIVDKEKKVIHIIETK